MAAPGDSMACLARARAHLKKAVQAAHVQQSAVEKVCAVVGRIC